jgi:uncharacterized protein with PQ loop repeat
MTELAKNIHKKYFEKHRKNPVVVEHVDRTMMIIGILSPAATFIQIITIIATKNTGGISIVSWVIYLFVTLAWFLYGFLHKSKPLIVIDGIGLVTNVIIIVEFFVFK